MTARQLTYYEFDERAQIECPSCGWSGTGADASREHFAELFDLRCPRCELMILIVSYPTIDETKAEAAHGNPRAIGDMAQVERIEDFQHRLEREQLRGAEQLPELEGGRLEFIWDFDSTKGEANARTVVTLDGHVIWNEPAIWEGADRFLAVKSLLKEKYGQRFASLTPSDRSRLYLYGDVHRGDVPTD